MHAAASVLGEAPAVCRANAYMAVMVDDLTLQAFPNPIAC
jgi:tRNA uridine 5-carboxymethylaminomethyl modification enzyme